jgi:FkbM family methyltransferase
MKKIRTNKYFHKVKRRLEPLIPYQVLSPIGKFMRDGSNNVIYNSVAPSGKSSIVIFGGYLGHSAMEWMKRYDFNKVEIFEPVSSFAKECETRFKRYSQVSVRQYALASRDGFAQIAIDGDASSLVELNSEDLGETIRLYDIQNWENRDQIFDICEINIEGAEYELLDLFAQRDVLPNLKNIFIQFHEYENDWLDKYNFVQSILSKSHVRVWNYPMVWEYWTIKTES